MHFFDFSPQMRVLIVSNAINFVAALVILVAGWTLAAWLSRWTRKGLHHIPQFDATLRPLVASLIRYAVVTITVIAVLQRFGVETTSLIAVLGAAGLAVGLALQGMLSNVAAGVMLLMLRPFGRGESVKFGDATGKVKELALFRTTLLTDDGVQISLPNAAIFSGTILNYHRESIRRTNFIVPIDQDTDIQQALDAAKQVLTDHPEVLKQPPPDVVVDSFSEGAINIAIHAWIDALAFGAVKDELSLKVALALKTAKVRFPQASMRVRLIDQTQSPPP